MEPGAYTLTASVVGYALVRRAVSIEAGGAIDFIIVLAPGTGTYEERVDVVAPIFEAKEPGTPSERTVSAVELQDLREMVADDPLRAIQALPGVTSTDDFTSEFSARGSGPRATGIVFDGVPAASVLSYPTNSTAIPAPDRKAATAALDLSMVLRNAGDSNEWFLLAMSHWQLGNKAGARKWYDKAVAWMERNQHSEELCRFRAEAEELMKIQPKND